MKYFLCAVLSVFCVSPAWAADPVVVAVSVQKNGMDLRVDVTLQHPDTGWDHYADGWEVLDADGNRLAVRELLHPHVHEQPFTRSLNNVDVPDGTQFIFIRPRCSIDDWSSNTTKVKLPQ